MGQSKVKSHTKVIKDLMGEKSHILYMCFQVGSWKRHNHSGCLYEESIAPLLDSRELEAAVHRSAMLSEGGDSCRESLPCCSCRTST